MTGDLLVRRALATDAPAIGRLFRSLAPYFTERPDGAGAEQFFATVTDEALAGYIDSPRYDYRVAETLDGLAGAIALRDRKHLYHLVVDLRFQGRGIGRQLWEVVRDAAVATGNPGEFTVNSSLYGVPVYRRFGFVPCGERTQANGVVFVPMRWETGSATTQGGAS